MPRSPRAPLVGLEGSLGAEGGVALLSLGRRDRAAESLGGGGGGVLERPRVVLGGPVLHPDRVKVEARKSLAELGVEEERAPGGTVAEPGLAEVLPDARVLHKALEVRPQLQGEGVRVRQVELAALGERPSARVEVKPQQVAPDRRDRLAVSLWPADHGLEPLQPPDRELDRGGAEAPAAPDVLVAELGRVRVQEGRLAHALAPQEDPQVAEHGRVERRGVRGAPHVRLQAAQRRALYFVCDESQSLLIEMRFLVP